MNEVKNIKFVIDKENKLVVIKAEIDGVIHLTADFRKPDKYREHYYGIFSSVTVLNDSNRISLELVDVGIYTTVEVSDEHILNVKKSHYIVVKIKNPFKD